MVVGRQAENIPAIGGSVTKSTIPRGHGSGLAAARAGSGPQEAPSSTWTHGLPTPTPTEARTLPAV